MKKPETAGYQLLTGTTAMLSYQQGGEQADRAIIAMEIPVAISFDGTTHGVMMATPDNLEDFAIGFSLTEGLISRISEGI